MFVIADLILSIFTTNCLFFKRRVLIQFQFLLMAVTSKLTKLRFIGLFFNTLQIVMDLIHNNLVIILDFIFHH